MDDDTPVPPSVHLLPKAVIVPDRPWALEICLSSWDKVHTKICDFGEAYISNFSPFVAPAENRLHIARPYAAPEVIFHDISSPTPSMDIWALAVLLLTNINLFTPFFSMFGNENEVIRGIVVRIGKLPDRWWTRWNDRAEFFNENGELLGRCWVSTNLGIKPNSGDYNEEEVCIFNGLLERMLRYDAKEKVSAHEVARTLADLWLPGVSSFFQERKMANVLYNDERYRPVGVDEVERTLADLRPPGASNEQEVILLYNEEDKAGADEAAETSADLSLLSEASSFFPGGQI
ncbi:hypothetical protein BDQ17DRAFT_259898 [Cyathus striatus]|nr:hypothetical protein BDQ17DRAFT_259898 [Cyathus striatus]